MFKVAAMIRRIEKGSGSIYAALRDVQRDAGNHETRMTTHETVAARTMPAASSITCCWSADDDRDGVQENAALQTDNSSVPFVTWRSM